MIGHYEKLMWATTCACFFNFLYSGEVVMQSEKEDDPEMHLAIKIQKCTIISQHLEVSLKHSKLPLQTRGNIVCRSYTI